MADLLFLPYLAHGHVHPMLAVASELVRRDERVTVAVSDEFAGQVTEVGARVLRVPRHQVRVPALRGVSEQIERLGLLGERWLAWAGAIAMVRRYLVTCRPRVVLADVRLPWAAPTVRRSGIPLVSLCTTHTGVPRRATPVLVNAPAELWSARRRPRRAAFVAPLVRPVEPDAAVDPLREWLTGGRMLLVAPGTVFARRPEFFRGVAEEFADSDWRVLMATGPTQAAELGRLPPNVLARNWLPQRQLLRHATVLLGHGGMNSVQEALLAAVPMLLTPRNKEQARTAQRLAELGLAVVAEDAWRTHAEHVVDQCRTRSACEAMRERLAATPGPVLAADVLTAYGRDRMCRIGHGAP